VDCACVYAVFKQATLCFGLYCVGAQTKFGLFAFVALFFVFLFEFAADDACTPCPYILVPGRDVLCLTRSRVGQAPARGF
jgi:hypothetical protein